MTGMTADYFLGCCTHRAAKKTGRGTSAVDAFTAPKWLLAEAKAKAKREDMTFSQLMRRALRKEIGTEAAK